MNVNSTVPSASAGVKVASAVTSFPSKLVVFDELYRADTLLAVHKDIDAEDQTVEIRVPKIGTTATFEDGEKEIIANEEITIIDSVAYSDLKPGKEYTVSGVLMDKETGKAFLDINGEEVRASTTFVFASGELSMLFFLRICT